MPEPTTPLDPNEAPEGYYAIPKSHVRGEANICNACDWRETCNDPETSLLAPGHRCMQAPVVSRWDGKTYQRKDGWSVVFKRRPAAV